MLISKEGKFVFVHVQKNAGLSIERVLTKAYPDAMIWHGRHGHAINGIRGIGHERWNEYYSFGFVRNPWDRMVSWYTMIQDMRSKLPADRKDLDEPFDSPFWNHATRDSHDFESFLENCTDVIYDKGCYKSYAFNQADYFSDEDGNIAVSFVARFENLIDDTSKIFKHLGFEVDSLPRINATSHGHYSEYYTQKTRDLVAQRFKRDIELFGYSFESHPESKYS